MIDLQDQIQMLRRELKNCGFTRRERIAAQAQLDHLIAEHAEHERALDAALEAIDKAEVAGAA